MRRARVLPGTRPAPGRALPPLSSTGYAGTGGTNAVRGLAPVAVVAETLTRYQHTHLAAPERGAPKEPLLARRLPGQWFPERRSAGASPWNA
jgi:hypothetical protein